MNNKNKIKDNPYKKQSSQNPLSSSTDQSQPKPGPSPASAYDNQVSSCDCYNCANNLQKPEKKYATNCDFSPYFECKNRYLFKTQVEPDNKTGTVLLNPTNISKSYAADFYPVDCSKSPIGDFTGTGYSSTDPRLISSAHFGQILVLDKPPTDEDIKLKDVYTDPRMKYYGQKYNDYRDINAGQIMYYIDKSIEDTLYQPIFENPAEIEGHLYKDPMGGTYPEYWRTPVKNNNVLKTKNRTYSQGLSSIDDTNEFREDIIHKQMRVNDRRRYEPRYTGNISY